MNNTFIERTTFDPLDLHLQANKILTLFHRIECFFFTLAFVNSYGSQITMNTIGSTSAQHQNEKNKVIFVMGAKATGKSKLSIDLATRFHGEVINSDKIQAFKGLDIITNKVTEEEARGVPHHLIGIVDPEGDFTVDDFCHHVLIKAIDSILKNGHIPIIAGGSNSYLEKLVEDPSIKFREYYDCCFIWVGASLAVLYERVGKRVNEMAMNGLVEEVRAVFVPGADYTRDIKRAIGAPEMENYFLVENNIKVDEATKTKILANAFEVIKINTGKLVDSQLRKIQRLRDKLGWKMHRIDATSVHEKHGKDAEDTWKDVVLKKSLEIVGDFL
ncbi:LOW QUALITY PROTEIN: adenylate isopentenyltransferase 7, mitochondrial-like [Herrania umbratica]|uniref:LOW QUALITY PROTEIN: adenylate isopentenyltransferase 7, mitochondrial-like n=1 Tax=Herrania umbratica TaxID=108875 RepID=A0A6J1B4C3_9ROSI|nr:LOW QUALITY PROTEIN: adenylate isopentenyltransferase 7, mitochondrial-like [Herrania umbratica]